MSFLKDCKTKDLIRPNPQYPNLLNITTKTTVEECLNLLVSKNILSVPILDQNQNSFIGIIDIYQIMTFIAFAAYEPDKEPNLENILKNTDLMQPAANLLGNTGLKECDEINSLWCLSHNSGFKEPLEYLGKGVYRILVTFSDGTETKMITQTDLIRFIYNNLDQFGDYKDSTLSNHTTPNVHFIKQVHAIPTTTTALQAFQIMRLKQINALAIIDPKNGALVGNISDSDLRGFTHNILDRLFLPILDFLSAQGTPHLTLITCTPSSTIRDVLGLMLKEKIHRVWVVDELKKPVGVASMTDLALYFYSNTLDIWYPPDE